MDLPKPDPFPDPKTAQSPEEFAKIMAMRGYPIDTENCSFFNSHKRKPDPSDMKFDGGGSFFDELKRRGMVVINTEDKLREAFSQMRQDGIL